ncbi:MAG: DUF5615 family PIN-like protein [Planctomycetes bacterium]|nr:DUF5615 family PIN-like protein [Planctomycetota bacterium]
MKLRDFALLADENIAPAVIAYLRESGFDVVGVEELGLVGRADSEIIRRAVEQNRVVLTHDRDFGKLAIAMMEPIIGIVFLRPGHVISLFTIGSINALLREDPDLRPPFILVATRQGDEVAMRVRHY